MNINYNRRLIEGIKRSTLPNGKKSSADLEWLNDSKIIERDGCFFFDRFVKEGESITINPYLQDATGVECFKNHFHFQISSLEQGVAIALILFDRIAELWRQCQNHGLTICQIVSIEWPEESSATYRFHVIRPGQSWLDSDLDKYNENIIVCE